MVPRIGYSLLEILSFENKYASSIVIVHLKLSNLFIKFIVLSLKFSVSFVYLSINLIVGFKLAQLNFQLSYFRLSSFNIGLADL